MNNEQIDRGMKYLKKEQDKEKLTSEYISFLCWMLDIFEAMKEPEEEYDSREVYKTIAKGLECLSKAVQNNPKLTDCIDMEKFAKAKKEAEMPILAHTCSDCTQHKDGRCVRSASGIRPPYCYYRGTFPKPKMPIPKDKGIRETYVEWVDLYNQTNMMENEDLVKIFAEKMFKAIEDYCKGGVNMKPAGVPR